MWRCEDVKMWRCEDVKMWRCEDVQMWGYEDVKMWRCEDVRMWRCEDVMMWGREDVKMWGCEVVKMWRCDDVKMWKYADPTFRRTLRSDALGNEWKCKRPFCDILAEHKFCAKVNEEERHLSLAAQARLQAIEWSVRGCPSQLEYRHLGESMPRFKSVSLHISICHDSWRLFDMHLYATHGATNHPLSKEDARKRKKGENMCEQLTDLSRIEMNLTESQEMCGIFGWKWLWSGNKIRAGHGRATKRIRSVCLAISCHTWCDFNEKSEIWQQTYKAKQLSGSMQCLDLWKLKTLAVLLYLSPEVRKIRMRGLQYCSYA